MQPTTINAKQLAAYLGVSLATFYNMLNDGRFPVQPIRNSKPRRWNIEQVDAWRLGN